LHTVAWYCYACAWP